MLLEHLLIYISTSTIRVQEYQLSDLRNVYNFGSHSCLVDDVDDLYLIHTTIRHFYRATIIKKYLYGKAAVRHLHWLYIFRVVEWVLFVVTAGCLANFCHWVYYSQQLSWQHLRKPSVDDSWTQIGAKRPKITDIRNYQQYLRWSEISFSRVNTFLVMHLQIIPKYHLVRLTWD